MKKLLILFSLAAASLGAPCETLAAPEVAARNYLLVDMSTEPNTAVPSPAYDASAKQKAQAKTSRIPIKVVPAEVLKKPEWIRVRAGSPTTRFYEIKQILREHKLHTVCEEASCPNIGECFGKGTATFMSVMRVSIGRSAVLKSGSQAGAPSTLAPRRR